MAASKPNKDLIGKGLRSLLQNIDADIQATGSKLAAEAVEKATVSTRIPLSTISINPKQPRRDFDEAALQELAGSIKLHDIVQPLTVS
ncbi:MAG: chromosome partitioning protein ParB, partial [Sphingobacteriia bacterium]